MESGIDIPASRVLTVDDYLPLSRLSVGRAVSMLPKGLRANYETAWRWFMSMSGTSGSRMLGKRIPGVSDDFPISAQRGIHVPANTHVALSVTVVRDSIYSASDQPLIHLPNGTWLLEYSVHRNNTGGKTDSRWNEGLFNCLKLGVPVGVFIQERGSKYIRYLAYVEEYHPERGVFTLHGPVTPESESVFSEAGRFAPSVSIEYLSGNVLTDNSSLTEMEEDNRRYAAIQRAVREGQRSFRKQLMDAYDGRCAGTGCSVTEALQAAHIIAYRGARSNAVGNGILLRADLHLLFDSSLISINPENYELTTSKRLADTSYSCLKGRELRLPKKRDLWPNESYLLAHFDRFRQIEQAS